METQNKLRYQGGETIVLVAIILGFLGVYIAILVGKRRKRLRELA